MKFISFTKKKGDFFLFLKERSEVLFTEGRNQTIFFLFLKNTYNIFLILRDMEQQFQPLSPPIKESGSFHSKNKRDHFLLFSKKKKKFILGKGKKSLRSLFSFPPKKGQSFSCSENRNKIFFFSLEGRKFSSDLSFLFSSRKTTVPLILISIIYRIGFCTSLKIKIIA